MLPLVLLLCQVNARPTLWYGPATVSFEAKIPGNPYDPAGNDVRVQFLGPKEHWRIAYFDRGTWKAVLVTDQPGSYEAALFRNGQKLNIPTKKVSIPRDVRLKDGYIRRHSSNRRFVMDSGRFYFPLGHNLGWQNPNLPPLTDQIALMGEHGLNWSRIWACHWDGKNPFWPQDNSKLERGRLWEPALQKWDSVVAASEKHGVPFQFVLFHHGLFSSRVNPNWPDHPWNAKNGGFLGDAADFFTDTRARNLAKAWLRYAVARWGHSPAIMAWELFNEVEWVDARYADRWDDITKWHDEMAGYLRSIDPYRHLVASSSTMEPLSYYRSMDFYQPHTYPPSVWSAIAGAVPVSDKPYFFGEYGPGSYDPEKERDVIRDGIWGGVVGGHAGAGQYWYWDRVFPLYYAEYKIASKILRDSKFAEAVEARPLPLMVETPAGGDLTFSPGLGWEATTKFTFELPSEATAANLAKLSGYLQSNRSGNRALFKEPLILRFRADRPGRFRIGISTISKAGADLRIVVNGREAAAKAWPAGDSDKTVKESLEAEFGTGEVEIKVENVGDDWLVMRDLTVTGIAPLASASAVGTDRLVLMRVRQVAGALGPVKLEIGGLGLSDGRYHLRETNLNDGTESRREVQVVAGRLAGGYSATHLDAVLVLSR